MGLFDNKPQTLADLADKPARLLKEEFTMCSHKKGFWFGTQSTVSDETGSYTRVVGDCKTCARPMVKILSRENEPA